MKIEVGNQYVDEYGNVWNAVAHSSKAGYVICECGEMDQACLFDSANGTELCVRWMLVREHRKPIEGWAVVEPGSKFLVFYEKAPAEEYAKRHGTRIVRLIEAPDQD